ncbi:MAG: hypothetical protein ABSB91_00170 [Sedimentisphaerales bacterium]
MLWFLKECGMHIVKFVRTTGSCQEEYGQIRFDGEKICFDGLTCIFQKYLEKGVTGSDNRTYKPADGIQFLINLKHHLAQDALMAADVVEG